MRLVKYMNVYVFKKSAQALISILPGILISLKKGVLTAVQPRSFAAFQRRGSSSVDLYLRLFS
ncbi:hypothetical protein DOZ91_08985 [Peribacillus frigoritolerans]|nr:hypothetical protein DOZ91_08985 [Peribacillus frigoritolerans]